MQQGLVLTDQRKDAVLSTNRRPHSGQSQNADATLGFRRLEFCTSLNRICAKRLYCNVVKELVINQIMS